LPYGCFLSDMFCCREDKNNSILNTYSKLV
jgi:hypothetical protein